MKTFRLYLLRHGEPEDTQMFYGHKDVALSPRGHEQIAGQVRLLASARLDAVYSSDLFRARHGADAIAAHHGLQTRVDDRLREMHLGVLEGLGYAQARQRFPSLVGIGYEDMLDRAFEGGGESVRALAERVVPTVSAAIIEHAVTGAAGIAVVAHNTVTRVILARAVGLGVEGYARFDQRYGAVNRIDFDRRRVAEQPWSAARIAYCNLDPLASADTV